MLLYINKTLNSFSEISFTQNAKYLGLQDFRPGSTGTDLDRKVHR